jgi:hypothetical protein
VRIATDAWRGLILLHRGIDSVKTFHGLDVRVLFDQTYESFERFGSRHQRAIV